LTIFSRVRGSLDIEREKLLEGVTQSKKLLLSEEGNILHEAILNGSKLDLNLNVLTLTAKENKS